MTMENYASEMFLGWQRYPSNLSLSALDVDTTRCDERLKENTGRLFISQEADCQLKMLNLTSQNDTTHAKLQVDVKSSEQLALCLKLEQTTLVFQIIQEYSWGQFLITEELFRKLFTALKVHPGFLDVVHMFGEKISAVEESFAAFFTRLYPELPGSQDYSYEIAYSIAYVARHGRTSPADPFSIRQTGIYQKFRPQSARAIWILLQPSEILVERLSKAFKQSEVHNPTAQLQYHALIFHCLSENWREYVNYLEGRFSTLMDRGFFSNLERSTREGTIDADFSDIRRLQIMTDKLNQRIHLLNLNENVCERLQVHFNRVLSASPPESAQLSYQYEAMLEGCMFQFKTHALQLKTLVSRAEGVGSLIQRILDIRSAETSHKINSAMHDLSKQSAAENKLVRLLASQTTRDTRSMRVIALISSIFLPATFVATFFGSNFFGFEDTKDGHNLAVASNIWIYVIVALVFSAIAMSLWYWWYSRSSSMLKDVDLESD